MISWKEIILSKTQGGNNKYVEVARQRAATTVKKFRQHYYLTTNEYDGTTLIRTRRLGECKIRETVL